MTPWADDLERDTVLGGESRGDAFRAHRGEGVGDDEWVQGRQRYVWSAGEVRERLRERMQAAFAAVHAASHRLDVDLRTAALSLALERVSEAARLRAVFP